MKSVYLRNFVATATLVTVSFLLTTLAFIGIARSYVINDYQKMMESSAAEVTHLASAVSDYDGLHSWSLSISLSSIANSTGNHIFITDAQGEIVCCSDKRTNCNHIGKKLPENVMEMLPESGTLRLLSTLGTLYGEKRYVVAQAIDGRAEQGLRVEVGASEETDLFEDIASGLFRERIDGERESSVQNLGGAIVRFADTDGAVGSVDGRCRVGPCGGEFVPCHPNTNAENPKGRGGSLLRRCVRGGVLRERGQREREEGKQQAFHFHFVVLSCGGVRDCPQTLNVHQSSIVNDNANAARLAGGELALVLALVDIGGIGGWWTMKGRCVLGCGLVYHRSVCEIIGNVLEMRGQRTRNFTSNFGAAVTPAVQKFGVAVTLAV